MSSGNNIEQAIREAIIYATTELDYTLVHSDWGNSRTQCSCPLSCVILKNNSADEWLLGEEPKEPEAVAKILGVSSDWIYSFIYGFDNAGRYLIEGEVIVEARELGQKIFNDFNPPDYYAFLAEKRATS